MSEVELLAGVAHDLFRAHSPPEAVTAAEAAGWAPDLWAALDAAGFPLLGVPEAAGGSGGWAEVAAVLRLAGRFAAPVPLAETGVLAGRLLAEAGLPVPSGPLTLALPRPGETVTAEPTGAGWRLDGTVTRVPWARRAVSVVVVAAAVDGTSVVAAVDPAAATIGPGTNLAGEPRETVRLDRVRVAREAVAPLPADVDPRAVLARGALVRAHQIAGALGRVLELGVEYVRVREQFGRPLSRFQVLQHDLARLAGEVYAARAAADNAIDAVLRLGDELAAWPEIAAARVRAGAAANRAAMTAHQVHGAIGFTDEHQLRHLTRRLWSWRDEFGTERFWAEALGRTAAEAGPDGLWPLLTRSPA